MQNEQPPSPNKSEPTLEKVLLTLYREQRRDRYWRWGWRGIFLFLIVVFIGVLPWQHMGDVRVTSSEPHTALIRLNGIVTDQYDTGSTMSTVLESLQEAFEHQQTRGVILAINSPGGSPTYARRIYNKILWLRSEHADIPIYVVIEDIGASAAYYISLAGDAIYADGSSLVGSIGVRSGSFGLVDMMKKLGIERRLYVAGEHKGFLDPFSPEDKAAIGVWRQTLESIHRQFIDIVKERRTELSQDDQYLFSGLVWDGKESLRLGLIDGFGEVDSIARDVVGIENIVDFTAQRSLLDEIGFSLGAGIAATMHRWLYESIAVH